MKGLDATSAPGNKTLQFSQLVGEVLSFEKDEQRFGILKKRVHEYRARNVITINDDFLETKPEENPNLQGIDVVICDPSCSGSGMKMHQKG